MDNRPSNFGSSPVHAEIRSVSGVNSNGEGITSDIRYTVVVFSPQGDIEFANVVPSCRRPVNNPDAIISAGKPGDIVIVSMRGDEIRFGIIEGLANPDTCESA